MIILSSFKWGYDMKSPPLPFSDKMTATSGLCLNAFVSPPKTDSFAIHVANGDNANHTNFLTGTEAHTLLAALAGFIQPVVTGAFTGTSTNLYGTSNRFQSVNLNFIEIYLLGSQRAYSYLKFRCQARG